MLSNTANLTNCILQGKPYHTTRNLKAVTLQKLACQTAPWYKRCAGLPGDIIDGHTDYIIAFHHWYLLPREEICSTYPHIMISPMPILLEHRFNKNQSQALAPKPSSSPSTPRYTDPPLPLNITSHFTPSSTDPPPSHSPTLGNPKTSP